MKPWLGETRQYGTAGKVSEPIGSVQLHRMRDLGRGGANVQLYNSLPRPPAGCGAGRRGRHELHEDEEKQLLPGQGHG